MLTPGETISSLIERAGGFTREAFVEALRFRSADAKAQQRAAVDRALIQTQKAAALVNNNLLQSGLGAPQLNQEVFAVEVEGRIVVDVPRILAGDASADIAVQGGDEILFLESARSFMLLVMCLNLVTTVILKERPLSSTSIWPQVTPLQRREKTFTLFCRMEACQRLNERKRLLDFGGNTSEIVAGTTIVVPPKLDYAKPLDFYTQVSSVVFQSMASIAAFFNIARN